MRKRVESGLSSVIERRVLILSALRSHDSFNKR